MSEAGDGASNWRDDPAWPDVDVVLPIRNEAAHLAAALATVRAQTYPGRIRVFIGLGPSDDGTFAVAQRLAEADPDLVVVESPTGLTPAALNTAIRAGHAPVVVRVDGHCTLSRGYIRRAVETLRRTGAVNVGGMQVPVGTTPFEVAVARATASRFGTGGAAYRVGGAEHAVDTVYLGVFDRDAIEAVGLFDERLIRNQDYELNIRLRRAGGVVLFDPHLAVEYTPRGSWRALATQYFEYGRWKAVVLTLHPRTLKLRQVAPVVATVGVGAGLLAGLFRRRLLVLPIAYAVTVVAASRQWRQAAVLATIHLSWGTGFLSSVTRVKRFASTRRPIR